MTKVLEFLEAYGGGILLGAFLLLMARIVYWFVVIVPRRTGEIYARLEATGYAPRSLDDPTVAQVLAQHAPIFPKDPPADAEVPPWRVRRAAVQDQWGRQRLLVNAQRWQLERTGVRNSNLRCNTTILVETWALPLGQDLHLVPAENSGRIRWEERYGLPRASSGLDPELATRYEVHAAPGAVVDLPEPLVKVLVEACPLLVDQSRFCYQHGVSLRFGPEGWGVATSNEVYEQGDMDRLLDLADRVAEALRA